MKDIQLTMKSGAVIRIDTKQLVCKLTEDDDVIKVELLDKKESK